MPDLEHLFSADGPLARRIPGYRLRPQQVGMARRIADAIAASRILVTEAGTGTGKTLAYLVPALLGGGKVILSTGTKTLQDQLFQRDLPAVRDALGIPLTIALLKGRANYVCPWHLQRTQEAGLLASRESVADLHKIARFARVTHSGDKAECADVAEDAPIWAMVTSTRDNCLGQECPVVRECFVLNARREALAADVVVVNHHLFFADLMLREGGAGELLPACNTVVFDEAHQLPETASLFFGESLSTGQLLDLARDVRNESLLSAPDFPPLGGAARSLDKAARDLRLAVAEENVRLSAGVVGRIAGFDAALTGLADVLQDLTQLLELQAERGEGLQACWRRAQALQQRLRRWRTGGGPAEATVAEEDDAMAPSGAADIRWVEVFRQALALNTTPLSVAELFRKELAGRPRAWIFTSATLAVGQDFSHYCGEIGLTDAETACWESPFDYPQQALLYVPRDMPEPNVAAYPQAVVEAAWPLIQACPGGVFLLCTSLRAMRAAHERLRERLAAQDAQRPLMLQGDGSRSEMLERFRRAGNAVLVASQSFWEGVDVRGDALSLVIIDKLPFAPPDDPVLAARIDHLKRNGGNPFNDYQLPRAVIAMKQGAGRLIRDERDRGVLAVCDPRLVSRPYGRRIWQALPPMRRTRELAEVTAFLQSLSRPAATS